MHNFQYIGTIIQMIDVQEDLVLRYTIKCALYLVYFVFHVTKTCWGTINVTLDQNECSFTWQKGL